MPPKKSYRQLQPGERLPDGEPKRYVSGAGYMRLRWKVAPYTYVEVYEHRVIAGVVSGEQVHHINGDKLDNRPENLQCVSNPEHRRLHRKVSPEHLIELYDSGLSVTEVGKLCGLDGAHVSRSIRRYGGASRPPGETNKIKFDTEQIRGWMEEGLSDKAIARRLGVTDIAIKRVRTELGVPPRRPGRPARAEGGYDGWPVLDASDIVQPEFPRTRLAKLIQQRAADSRGG